MDDTLYDVIIVGAGISGRNSAKIQMITPTEKNKRLLSPNADNRSAYICNENQHQLVCEFFVFAIC